MIVVYQTSVDTWYLLGIVHRTAFALCHVIVQIWMLSFRFAHCWTLFFLDTFLSILCFLPFLIVSSKSLHLSWQKRCDA
jgi:hypothetical protein